MGSETPSSLPLISSAQRSFSVTLAVVISAPLWPAADGAADTDGICEALTMNVPVDSHMLVAYRAADAEEAGLARSLLVLLVLSPLHSRGALRGAPLRPGRARAPAPAPAGRTDGGGACLVLITPLDRLDRAAAPPVDVSDDGPTDRQNGDVWDTGNTALLAHGVASSSTYAPALVDPSLAANRMGSLLSEPCCSNAAALYLREKGRVNMQRNNLAVVCTAR